MTIRYRYKLLTVFGVIAFLLNVVWEAIHGAWLYEQCFGKIVATLDPQAFTGFALEAATLDALLLLLVVLVGNYIFANGQWIVRMNPRRWGYLILTTLAVAAAIEVGAVYLFREWSYSPLMPTVLGIGISPLVQLFITAAVSIGIINVITKS